MNVAQNQVVGEIIDFDGALEWDETAYGDLPEGTLSVVSGQRAVSLLEDENTADTLVVVKVLLKNQTGDGYTVLDRITVDDLEKTYGTRNDATGIPCHYRMSGKNCLLYPTPNYSLAAGLKVFFIRTPKPITVADTIREISMPTIFHQLIAYITAYNYAVAKRMDNRNDILNMIEKEKVSLGLFVSNMDRANPTQIRTVYRSSR
jgi:hypothetical protein